MDLIQGRAVVVNTPTMNIVGCIVGKATTDLTQTYIVKCLDDQLPNLIYPYDTMVAPRAIITVR